jgi:hypothetical protein
MSAKQEKNAEIITPEHAEFLAWKREQETKNAEEKRIAEKRIADLEESLRRKPDKKAGFGWKEWLVAGCLVIVVVALAAMALNSGTSYSTNGSNENQVNTSQTVTLTQSQLDELEAKAKAEAEANAQKIVDEKIAAFEAKQAEKEARDAEAEKERELQEAKAALAAAEKRAAEEGAAAALLSSRLERPVAAPVSALSTTGTQFEIRMGVDEFEDSITTKNDDGYVTVQKEEFARMFHGMSPPEQHPQFGTVSYPLMKGKKGPTFCHSEVGHSDPPPIKIPTGYREWRTDNTGRWMAVK